MIKTILVIEASDELLVLKDDYISIATQKHYWLRLIFTAINTIENKINEHDGKKIAPLLTNNSFL